MERTFHIVSRAPACRVVRAAAAARSNNKKQKLFEMEGINMKTSSTVAALLAALFLLQGGAAQAGANANNQAAAGEPTEAQIEEGLKARCAKYSPNDQQGCFKRELEAKAIIDRGVPVTKAVNDKCMVMKVMRRGYAAVLTCIADAGAPSDAAAATALSAFAGAAQEEFVGMSLRNRLFVPKIQQDMEFKDLDKYREDSNALTDMARESRKKVSELRYPTTLSSKQRAQFEAVSQAANAYSESILTMESDVSVNADTGLDVASKLDRDMALSKKAGRKFRSTVMAAYKALGYAENQVNPETLKLKKL
jgi:hypothetical protein